MKLMGYFDWLYKKQDKTSKTDKTYHTLYVIMNSGKIYTKTTFGEYPCFEDSKKANEFVEKLKLQGIKVTYTAMKFSEESYIELKERGFVL